jgi:hypothetical protein
MVAELIKYSSVCYKTNKIYYCLHQSWRLDFVFKQLNPVHTNTHSFWMWCLILPPIYACVSHVVFYHQVSPNTIVCMHSSLASVMLIVTYCLKWQDGGTLIIHLFSAAFYLFLSWVQMIAASRSYTSSLFIEWEGRANAREIWPRVDGYGEIRADVSEEHPASIIRVGDRCFWNVGT